MGEINNIPESEQEKEEKIENEVKEEKQEKEETNLVKHLRKQLEEKIQKEKEMENKLKEIENIFKIANLDEVAEKLKKVDKLEFESQVLKNFPHLSGEVEDIWKERKEGETIEDAVARYIGKKQIVSQYGIGSKKIAPNLQEQDISSLPPKEREQKARELFREIYGKE